MQMHGVWTRKLGWVALAGGLWACGAEDPNCPRVQGEFVPLYTAVADGNGDGYLDSCDSLTDVRVDFNTGTGAAAYNVQMRNADEVTTEVVLKGCTMRMTQTVKDQEGTVMQRIDGESLAIHSATEVSGQVEVQTYDPQGQPACYAIYDARFTQNNQLIAGGARQR